MGNQLKDEYVRQIEEQIAEHSLTEIEGEPTVRSDGLFVRTPDGMVFYGWGDLTVPQLKIVENAIGGGEWQGAVVPEDVAGEFGEGKALVLQKDFYPSFGLYSDGTLPGKLWRDAWYSEGKGTEETGLHVRPSEYHTHSYRVEQHEI